MIEARYEAVKAEGYALLLELVGIDTSTYVDLMDPSSSELASYVSGTDFLVHTK